MCLTEELKKRLEEGMFDAYLADMLIMEEFDILELICQDTPKDPWAEFLRVQFGIGEWTEEDEKALEEYENQQAEEYYNSQF